VDIIGRIVPVPVFALDNKPSMIIVVKINNPQRKWQRIRPEEI
jgi:hypothetical protein